jgi:hypothetical protein
VFAIERACAALPTDFHAATGDSITAGALSRRAPIKATRVEMNTRAGRG